MKPGPVRLKGVLTTWNDDRGFGFVAPVVGGADVFVHITAFPEGAPRPVAGDEIEYLLEFSREGKPRASAAWLLRQVPVPARVRRQAEPATPFGFLAIAGFGVIVLVVSVLGDIPFWTFVLYVGSSIVTFIAYAVDKRAAQTGGWRVAESSLLALGVVGGWPGAILAQQLLRHKTIKPSFQWMFWISVVVNVIAFVLLSWVSRLPMETV